MRLTSPSDYYVVRASVPEQNVVLYRMVKGIAREIAVASVEVSPEKWHTLALHADGDQFSGVFRLQEFVCRPGRHAPQNRPRGVMDKAT